MRSKVLVSEHDAATLELMREVFTLHGISMQVLNTTAEITAIVDQEKFDAVFLDLSTRPQSGFDVIRSIRQSSWNKSVPIVMLPERLQTNERLEAFQAGGTFFLEKPLDRTKLTRLLRSTRGIMAEEHRRYARVPLSTRVECRSGEHQVAGSCVNLSREGILFNGDGSLKRGQQVELDFSLGMRKPAVRARGIVTRTDEHRRVGVRLMPASADDAQMIREYIARQVEVV
jgi:CheY-like chemotaxis protein